MSEERPPEVPRRTAELPRVGEQPPGHRLPSPRGGGGGWLSGRGRGWLLGLLVAAVVAGLALMVTAFNFLPTKPTNQTQPDSAPLPSDGSASVGPSPSVSASASASAAASPSPSVSRTPPRTNLPPGPGLPGANHANCAPKPSSCGLPDASNTGVPAGTRLSVQNGDVTVTQAGAVIDGKDIRGCVEIKAPRVTIRRTKITCTGFYVISSFSETYSGGGLLIEDVEIDCQNTNHTGIGSYGLTARRLNIHGCENGFDVDTDMTVTDSYVHDLYEGSTGHADGIQLAKGGARITISHNTIFNPGGTSAIISDPTTNSDVLVGGNLMAGGAYTLYCPRDSSRNYRVLNNRFSTYFSAKGGAYGPWTDCEKAAEVRGNVWDSNLQPLR